MELPVRIKIFIERTKWTFAKTYADTWQHEYIVQEKVDTELFSEFTQYIDYYALKNIKHLILK